MNATSRKPNCQLLAERTGALVATVNQLIADIESDLNAPAGAVFNAKVAHRALQDAYLDLSDAAREQRVRHYQGVAQQAAA